MKDEICEHCGGKIAIRFPLPGITFCDHIYYPEYCKICSKEAKKKEMAMKKKELVAVDKSPKPMTMEDILNEGRAYIKSGILPAHIKNEYQYAVIRQKGWELGIKPLTACSLIYVINGVSTVAPKLMLALVNRTGELEDINIVKDDVKQRVIVTVKRKGRAPYTESFGKEEATALGLIYKDNYKKQPMRMYLWRALSLNLNVSFPDALNGMITPEEVGAEVIFSDEDDLDLKTVKIAPQIEAKAHQEAAGMMVAEILAGLNKLHGGDVDAARDHLKNLTTYKAPSGEECWYQPEGLEALAKEKPSWVERIYEKIMPEIKEAEHGEELAEIANPNK